MQLKFFGIFSLMAFAAVVGAYRGSSTDFNLEVSAVEGTQYHTASSTDFTALLTVGQASEEAGNTSYLAGTGNQRAFVDSPQFVGFASASGTRASCCGPYGFTTNLKDKTGIDAVLFQFDNVNYSGSFVQGNVNEGQWGITFTAPGTALYSYRWWAHNKAGQWNASNSDTFEVTATSSATTTPTTAPTAAPAVPNLPTSTSTPPQQSGSTPVPSENPTQPSSVPEATVEPTSAPTPEPVKTDEVVVVIEEPENSQLSDVQVPPVVKVTHGLAQEEFARFGGSFGHRSIVAVIVENTGNTTIKNAEVTVRYPFLQYIGPNPDDYPIDWGDHKPIKIEPGSAVVTWLFDNVEPGQKVKTEFKTEQVIEKSDLEKVTTPKVIAQKTAAPSTSVTQEVKPASADYTLPLIAIGVLILAAAGYFLFGRKKGM